MLVRYSHRFSSGSDDIDRYKDDRFEIDLKDEVLRRSGDEASMVEFIEIFLATLTKHDLKVSLPKAEIGARRISFLVRTISPQEIIPGLGKVSARAKMPKPKSVSELRSSYEVLSNCRKFLKNLAKELRPINRMLKEDVPFLFTPEMEATVRRLLSVLSEHLVLVYPDLGAARDKSGKCMLCCDASEAGFGAALEQAQSEGTVRPIVYLSRATSPNEQEWFPVEKEAGCNVWAIKCLRQYLYLIAFEVLTDHAPLTSIAKVGDSNARVQRWMEFLTAHNCTVVYQRGAANSNADVSSRLPQPATTGDTNEMCRIIDPEDLAVFSIRASGLRPRRNPLSVDDTVVKNAEEPGPSLGLGGLLSPPEFSHGRKNEQYLHRGQGDVEDHPLANSRFSRHSLCTNAAKQVDTKVSPVARQQGGQTADTVLRIASRNTLPVNPTLPRRSSRRRFPSRVPRESLESFSRDYVFSLCARVRRGNQNPTLRIVIIPQFRQAP